MNPKKGTIPIWTIFIVIFLFVFTVITPMITGNTTWFETIPISEKVKYKVNEVIPENWYVEQIDWLIASRHGEWLEYYVVIRDNDNPYEWTNDFVFYNTNTDELKYDFRGVASNNCHSWLC